MKVLGIDTILHNTCAAVVENGRRVLSNVVQSHEFESRQLYRLTIAHLGCIGAVMKKAVKKAGLKLEKIELVAVNNFGSQVSNVLVGVAAAQLLGALHKVPVIGVPHQEAHLFSCWLERDPREFEFPVIVLSSSGGHSAVSLIKNGNLGFKNIMEIEGMRERGKNLPNFRGIGAIYGFVAHALKLGGEIGGAPLLSKVAEGGNFRRFNLFFPRPKGVNILDFSFLEKGVNYFLNKGKNKKGLSRQFVADFAASFEYAVSETVLNDLLAAARKHRAKEIHLVGGISANRIFRRKLPVFASKIGAVGRTPVKPEYSTDNAAMTASLGYYRYGRDPGRYSNDPIFISSNLRLEKMAIEQILSKKPRKKFYRL